MSFLHMEHQHDIDDAPQKKRRRIADAAFKG